MVLRIFVIVVSLLSISSFAQDIIKDSFESKENGIQEEIKPQASAKTEIKPIEEPKSIEQKVQETKTPEAPVEPAKQEAPVEPAKQEAQIEPAKQVAPVKPATSKNTKNILVDKYFILGFYSFQNKSEIKTPDSKFFPLNYTTSGLIFGYVESLNIKKLKIGTNISLFYGNTDGRSESSEIYYFKKKLLSAGVVGSINLMFPFSSDRKYFLGPELSANYIYTKWYIPTTSNGQWEIKKTFKPQFAPLLVGEYYLEKYYFYHKFGYPISGSSFIWNIGLGIKL